MSAAKRAWIILAAILVLELIPFTLTLAWSSSRAVHNLYGFDASFWPAWVAGFGIAAIYVVYAARAFPSIRQNFLTLNWITLAAVPFAVVTGTVEELYFRKFLMDWASYHGVASFGQVLASALAFGLAHGIWGLFARQWRMAVGATLATGILGALLGVIYLAAGRHVAPCIWAHILINLAIEPWLTLAACSGGIRRPQRAA
jgi:hypothetical protein